MTDPQGNRVSRPATTSGRSIRCPSGRRPAATRKRFKRSSVRNYNFIGEPRKRWDKAFTRQAPVGGWAFAKEILNEVVKPPQC